MYGDSKELNEIGEINQLIYSNNNFKVYGDLTINNNLHIIKVMMFNKLDENGYMKIARISMEKPEYIDCEYKSYIFTKEELQEFINCLSSKRDTIFHLKHDQFPFTVWDTIINEMNYTYNLEEINKQVPTNLSIPDYSKLNTCD